MTSESKGREDNGTTSYTQVEGLARRTCLIIMMVVISGCVTLRVASDSAQGADEVPHEVTMHRWLWGQIWDGVFIDTSCVSNSLHEVEATTTFWQTTLTILTLGIYCPIDIKYSCAKVPTVVTCPPCDSL